MNDYTAPFRLKPTDICMADAMPFQQHWEVRVAGRDLEDVLTDELFLSVAKSSNLRVGDEVVVCGYASQTWERLQQFVRLRLTSIEPGAVKFLQDGEVRSIPAEKVAPAAERPKRELEVAREFGGGFTVRERKSNSVLERFKTKAEAVAWAKAHDVAA